MKQTPESLADLLVGRPLKIVAVRVQEKALYHRPLLGIDLVAQLLLQVTHRRLLLVHAVG